MEIVIPKKIRKKKHNYSSEYYNFELIKIYPHHVTYKCIETGNIESFSKNNFVSEVETRERKRTIKYKPVK